MEVLFSPELREGFFQFARRLHSVGEASQMVESQMLHGQRFVSSLRVASVQAYDFPIDDDILDRKVRQSYGQGPETLVLILFSRYESAGSVFDVG
jgi:hypothetical protein